MRCQRRVNNVVERDSPMGEVMVVETFLELQDALVEKQWGPRSCSVLHFEEIHHLC